MAELGLQCGHVKGGDEVIGSIGRLVRVRSRRLPVTVVDAGSVKVVVVQSLPLSIESQMSSAEAN